MTFEEQKEIIKGAVDKSSSFIELLENIIKDSYMKGLADNEKKNQGTD